MNPPAPFHLCNHERVRNEKPDFGLVKSNLGYGLSVNRTPQLTGCVIAFNNRPLL
jgi:hypothetical protein